MKICAEYFPKLTRTVPCELWFLDRDKPEKMRPEQRKNLTSIVWLYRGQEERFLKLVEEYLDTTIKEAKNSAAPVEGFIQKLANLLEKLGFIERTGVCRAIKYMILQGR